MAKPDARRHARAAVPRDKGVVFALFGRREGLDALEAAVGREGIATSRQYLVPIGLVPHVPHDAVVRRIIDVMQGHGEFYSTQAGGKVSRVTRHFFDDVLSQFLADFGQLFYPQFPQVFRGSDAVQQAICSQVRIHLSIAMVCYNRMQK